MPKPPICRSSAGKVTSGSFFTRGAKGMPPSINVSVTLLVGMAGYCPSVFKSRTDRKNKKRIHLGCLDAFFFYCDYLTKKIIHTKLNFSKFFTIKKYHIIFSKNCRAICQCIFDRRFCYSSTSAVTSYPPLKMTVISVLLITFTHSISFLTIMSSYSVSLLGRFLTVLSASFI